MSFAWTDERKAKLGNLAAAGMSASQIAEAMGAPTRSTIIGKAHRLGIKLTGRKSFALPKLTPSIKTKTGEGRQRRMPRALPIEKPIVVAFDPPTNDNVALPRITAGQCRWPLGDPRDVDGFRFCGATTVLTYCRYHHRLAYRAGTAIKKPARRPVAAE